MVIPCRKYRRDASARAEKLMVLGPRASEKKMDQRLLAKTRRWEVALVSPLKLVAQFSSRAEIVKLK